MEINNFSCRLCNRIINPLDHQSNDIYEDKDGNQLDICFKCEYTYLNMKYCNKCNHYCTIPKNQISKKYIIIPYYHILQFCKCDKSIKNIIKMIYQNKMKKQELIELVSIINELIIKT